MLEHGGQLRSAAAQWNIPLADWLDLSTGIAPHPYPVSAVPDICWQRLPEEDDGLEAAAQAYYRNDRVLPLPGSQAAIQALPELRTRGIAAVLDPAYGEYAPAWQRAGHTLRRFAAAGLAEVSTSADVVMLANPNNPDARRFCRAELLAAARQLRSRSGWLIVDEAFADADVDSDASLAAVAGAAGHENVIVLRSLGKFFGLAGLRVGFALATPEILAALRERIGPWAVSHPAREIARRALLDHDWQGTQRQQLQHAGTRLKTLLQCAGFTTLQGTPLFCTVFTPHANQQQQHLAQQGILTRCFTEPSALRFGLPPDNAGWQRLESALTTLHPAPENTR